jgi:hypothetical protein
MRLECARPSSRAPVRRDHLRCYGSRAASTSVTQITMQSACQRCRRLVAAGPAGPVRVARSVPQPTDSRSGSWSLLWATKPALGGRQGRFVGGCPGRQETSYLGVNVKCHAMPMKISEIILLVKVPSGPLGRRSRRIGGGCRAAIRGHRSSPLAGPLVHLAGSRIANRVGQERVT